MAKKKKRKPFIITVSIIGLFIIIMVLRSVFASEEGVVVELVNPEEREITEIISANGKIQPVTEVKISPDVSGEIVELAIEEGQNVMKGDLLLKIKPDVYESMRERSEASLNSSKAQAEQIAIQLEQARINYDRNKQLFEQKAITQAEYEETSTQYDNLKAQLRMAEFNIASAEAALKESEENLQKTVIYAPMDGTISLLDVELGERVVGTAQMAGTEMLRIADLMRMEAKAEVNENDIVRVSLGDTANIEVDAYAGKIFKGVVTRIANTAMETTSTDQVTNFEVRIYILPESYDDLVTEGNPNPLRPGMSCTVDIITDRKNTLAVPIQSVTVREQEGNNKEVVFVYRLDSAGVAMRPVTTGIQDTRYIEIEGVGKDEQVVSAPYNAISKTLQDGSKVTVKASGPEK